MSASSHFAHLPSPQPADAGSFVANLSDTTLLGQANEWAMDRALVTGDSSDPRGGSGEWSLLELQSYLFSSLIDVVSSLCSCCLARESCLAKNVDDVLHMQMHTRPCSTMPAHAWSRIYIKFHMQNEGIDSLDKMYSQQKTHVHSHGHSLHITTGCSLPRDAWNHIFARSKTRSASSCSQAGASRDPNQYSSCRLSWSDAAESDDESLWHTRPVSSKKKRQNFASTSVNSNCRCTRCGADDHSCRDCRLPFFVAKTVFEQKQERHEKRSWKKVEHYCLTQINDDLAAGGWVHFHSVEHQNKWRRSSLLSLSEFAPPAGLSKKAKAVWAWHELKKSNCFSQNAWNSFCDEHAPRSRHGGGIRVPKLLNPGVINKFLNSFGFK
eukprot:TRINITY_DN14763_c0_g1_i1.p1 TRINITY_DN14763_c0_g1~~TRINITY_DN14763_c0_g1_i1.p1  ORF type:complete len:381 (-),score=26.09 TRINITY_DN14763_c0_g1_i1:382-1524(-)